MVSSSCSSSDVGGGSSRRSALILDALDDACIAGSGKAPRRSLAEPGTSRCTAVRDLTGIGSLSSLGGGGSGGFLTSGGARFVVTTLTCGAAALEVCYITNARLLSGGFDDEVATNGPVPRRIDDV